MRCSEGAEPLSQPAVQPQQPAGGSAVLVSFNAGQVAGARAGLAERGRVQHPHGPAAMLHPHRYLPCQGVEPAPVERARRVLVPAGEAQPRLRPGGGGGGHDTVEVGRVRRHGDVDRLPGCDRCAQVHVVVMQAGNDRTAGAVHDFLALVSRERPSDL